MSNIMSKCLSRRNFLCIIVLCWLNTLLCFALLFDTLMAAIKLLTVSINNKIFETHHSSRCRNEDSFSRYKRSFYYLTIGWMNILLLIENFFFVYAISSRHQFCTYTQHTLIICSFVFIEIFRIINVVEKKRAYISTHMVSRTKVTKEMLHVAFLMKISWMKYGLDIKYKKKKR